MSTPRVSMVPEDYDTLKIECLSLRKQLGEVNQELHSCRMRLKVIEALQHDYQSEIDMLQNEEIRQKQKYQETILHLEDTINKIRTAHSEKIISLETDVMKLEEKNECLEAQVDVLRKSGNDLSIGGDTSKLIEEILTLKEENNGYTENHEQLLTDLKNLQEKNMELQRCLAESGEENSQLKQILDCKKDELAEAISLTKKLNDDVACLKSELESYKNKPLDENSKGNSLFAEVNDRRVYLQNTVKKMKAEYLAMKQERVMNLNTIQNMQTELARVMMKWKSEREERTEDQFRIDHTLEGKIIILEEMLAKYRKDKEAKPVVLYEGNYEGITYFERVLKDKNKEIQDLEDQLVATASTRLILNSTLRDANAEKRRWQLEAMEKQQQLESLELERKIEANNNVLGEDAAAGEEAASAAANPVKTEVKAEKKEEVVKCHEEERRSNVTIRRYESSKKSVQEKHSGILKQTGRDNQGKAEATAIIEEDGGEKKLSLGKENYAEVETKPRKKATFSKDTVSPPKVVSSGRRMIVGKPVFFKPPNSN